MTAPTNNVDRVVIVHGPADPNLVGALTAVGLVPSGSWSDTTVWAPTVRRTPSDPVDAAASPSGRLLTVRQAAAELGVGLTTTRKLIREGQLESVHLGRSVRVPPAAVDDLVGRLRRPRGSLRRSRSVATSSAGGRD